MTANASGWFFSTFPPQRRKGGVLSHDQEWLGVRLALTWVLVFILLLTHRDTLGKFSLFTAPWSYQG